MRPGFIVEIDLSGVETEATKEFEIHTYRSGDFIIQRVKLELCKCIVLLLPVAFLLREWLVLVSFYRCEPGHSHWPRYGKAGYQQAGMVENLREVCFDQKKLICRCT